MDVTSDHAVPICKLSFATAVLGVESWFCGTCVIFLVIRLAGHSAALACSNIVGGWQVKSWLGWRPGFIFVFVMLTWSNLVPRSMPTIVPSVGDFASTAGFAHSIGHSVVNYDWP